MSTKKRGNTWTAYWYTTDIETGKRRQHSKGGFRLKSDAQRHLHPIVGQIARVRGAAAAESWLLQHPDLDEARASTELEQLEQARRKLSQLRADRAAIDAELRYLRDEIAQVAGVVYVLRRGDGLIKIGTTTNLRNRLQTHAAEQGEVDLLGTLPGGRGLELQLHRRFAAHRAEAREWFHPHPEVLALVSELDRATR